MPITPTIPIPGIVIDKLTYPVKKLLGFTAKNSMQAQGKSEKEIIQDLIKRDNPSFYAEETRDGGNEIDTYLYGTPYNTENTSNVGPSYENYLSANFPLRKHAVKTYDTHFGDTLYIDQKYKDQVLDELEQGKTVGASMGRYAHAPSYIVNTKDDERRPYDAGGHLMQFQYDKDGNVVANMADIYDFLPRDFEEKYGAIKEYGPIKTAGMYAMHYGGIPFIVRQNGIPVRFKEIVPEYKTEWQQRLGDFLSQWGDTYDLTLPLKLSDEEIFQIFADKEYGDDILNFMFQEGYLQPKRFKKGGSIHIKKKNRGSFTRWCKGKVTEECIRRGKNSSNPAIRKKATFAANARRWKHENGGILKAQEGTENLLTPHPLSPIGIALNQAKAAAKMKGEQQHLSPGIKEVVGPDGKKVAIRTEQPLVPLEQDIAEWMPGTGDVAEVGYIANDVKNGNLGSATLGAGLLFLPGNAGKLLKTNVGKKISNFLNKDLFNYDELWAKIKHPTWKKYAHGSDDPFFDIKNADMGYNGEVGIHMTDDVPIAEVFAKGYSDRPGKVYEFYAPKPTLETIDATDNAANIYIGNVERLAGGTFNSSNTNTFFENLLKKYGGEDVIQDIPVDNSYREDLNFMFPGTGDNLKKYTLKQDVTIPTKDEIWPNKPEHVKKQFEELGKRWNQFKIDKKDAAREVSKILSDNGHKVLKYENVQPREGLKTAYVLTDPSIIHLINPEHQFKMKHALTGLGAGLGVGYGVSQIKDE